MVQPAFRSAGMKKPKQLPATTNEKLKSVIAACFVEATDEENKILKRLSSTDANQQLISSFSYLREMNSQLPNIRVQTKNAFIARNQQFNAETNP